MQDPLDFESSASTSFTTPAIAAFIGDLSVVVNTQVEPVARYARLLVKLKTRHFPFDGLNRLNGLNWPTLLRDLQFLRQLL